MRIITLSLFITLGLLSCKYKSKEIEKLDLAKKYYQVLNNSNDSEILTLLADSVSIIETEYNYKQTFSGKEYVVWMKWDAVFEPTYEVLQMEQKGDVVKAKISKIDKRIFFLHKEPIITS